MRSVEESRKANSYEQKTNQANKIQRAKRGRAQQNCPYSRSDRCGRREHSRAVHQNEFDGSTLRYDNDDETVCIYDRAIQRYGNSNRAERQRNYARQRNRKCVNTRQINRANSNTGRHYQTHTQRGDAKRQL